MDNFILFVLGIIFVYWVWGCYEVFKLVDTADVPAVSETVGMAIRIAIFFTISIMFVCVGILTIIFGGGV